MSTGDAQTSEPEGRPTASAVRGWLRTVPTLVVIGWMLFFVLAVGGALLLWGANFADDMVHSQLKEQNIRFPPKGSEGLDPATFPGLQRYAGQAVDNGPKAKAYADQFIREHLSHVADGKSYSEVSAAANADPTNEKLAEQAQTLFRGETLRGLLLFAWGWSVVGAIALWVGIAAVVGAVVVLVALLVGFMIHRRSLAAPGAA